MTNESITTGFTVALVLKLIDVFVDVYKSRMENQAKDEDHKDKFMSNIILRLNSLDGEVARSREEAQKQREEADKYRDQYWEQREEDMAHRIEELEAREESDIVDNHRAYATHRKQEITTREEDDITNDSRTHNEPIDFEDRRKR